MKPRLAVLSLGLLVAVGSAAAPPARWAPTHKELQSQRNRWVRQANAHARAGETHQAIQAIQKALAMDRVTFGELRVASLLG